MGIAVNADIRSAAKAAGIKQWEVAAQLGISEPTLIRWLRFPLSADRENAILQAIAELSQNKQKEG